MANLLKTLRSAQLIVRQSPMILFTPSRNASHWNKDFKPAKFPKTKEELKKAAEKYNLFPEEYRPYADEGLYYGDYPHLPAGIFELGIESLDPYYPYDYPEHKRNFNEPIHAEIDLYGEHRWSQPEKLRLENWQYIASFLSVMAACLSLYYYLEQMHMYRPVLPKQLPINGTYYTFEPNDEVINPKKH